MGVVGALLFISLFVGVGASSGVTAGIAPNLGTVSKYVVLAGSAITNTGPSLVTGKLGLSPGTSCTGFQAPCIIPHTGLVAGTINIANAPAILAKTDLVTAYNSLASQTCNTVMTGKNLGGQTLVPNVYCFASSAGLTGTLTLNAGGNPNAVWIFQIGSTLTTASASSVKMSGGGNPCNVYWQVGSSATLGTTTKFAGSILALTSITATTGATVTGRLLARNGAVTMDDNTVNMSGCRATTTSTTTTSTTITSTTTTTIRD